MSSVSPFSGKRPGSNSIGETYTSWVKRTWTSGLATIWFVFSSRKIRGRATYVLPLFSLTSTSIASRDVGVGLSTPLNVSVYPITCRLSLSANVTFWERSYAEEMMIPASMRPSPTWAR